MIAMMQTSFSVKGSIFTISIKKEKKNQKHSPMGCWNAYSILVWEGMNRKISQNEIIGQISLQKMTVFGKEHLHRNLQQDKN